MHIILNMKVLFFLGDFNAGTQLKDSHIMFFCELHRAHIIQSTYVKSCVPYIFASLFFKSKRKYMWNKEKCFLFHFKGFLRSREHQSLELLKILEVLELSFRLTKKTRKKCSECNLQRDRIIWDKVFKNGSSKTF